MLRVEGRIHHGCRVLDVEVSLDARVSRVVVTTVIDLHDSEGPISPVCEKFVHEYNIARSSGLG